MHIIKLLSLSLVNFKGIRDLTMQFEDNTFVYGENGTGKTTLFDAFTWLLFGKDSIGRSDTNFNIKTLDPDTGKPIYHLEHSVTGVLLVDGVEKKLQRVFTEKWSSQRGHTEQILKNHQTEFYMNDVKISTKREYDQIVSEILSEDLFKLVTNPFYFNSLSPDAQKQFLLKMAGNVTDEEVAATNKDYQKLLADLNGTTLVQYAKEINARKKACNDVLAIIPSQIETAQKLMPEAEDWSSLEAAISQKKLEIQTIDSQIADKSKVNEAEVQRKVNIQAEIGNKKISLNNRKNEIKNAALSTVNAKQTEVRDLEYKISSKKRDQEEHDKTVNSKIALITSLDKDLQAMRDNFAKVRDEQLVYPDNAFVCPTCLRPLEVDDIEKKKKELEENFNLQKSERLKAMNAKGKQMHAEQDELIKKRDEELAATYRLKDEIAALEIQVEELKKNIPATPDYEAMISEDEMCISLLNEITELENQLQVSAAPVDCSALKQRKSELQEEVSELNARLANRQQIVKVQKEIKSLEEKREKNAQEKADLEKWEMIATDFQKDKDARLLAKINGMFSVVTFSFLKDQMNGDDKITCKCMVDGVPYADVNNAMKINAGIDIINALCKSADVTAPIFIDNRESVNNIIPTASQVINLVVSNDKSLTIK